MPGMDDDPSEAYDEICDGDSTLTSPPLPGFALAVAEIFSD